MSIFRAELPFVFCIFIMMYRPIITSYKKAFYKTKLINTDIYCCCMIKTKKLNKSSAKYPEMANYENCDSVWEKKKSYTVRDYFFRRIMYDTTPSTNHKSITHPNNALLGLNGGGGGHRYIIWLKNTNKSGWGRPGSVVQESNGDVRKRLSYWQYLYGYTQTQT